MRNEFVSLTGDYESAVLLNQIFFSRKDELTVNDVRRLALSDRTRRTLRKKLDRLVNLGCLSKRKGPLGGYLYKASDAVYPNDPRILALIEGKDLRIHPCYLTASILNRFRQLALADYGEVRVSARELKKSLGTEKSVGLVRLILKRLVALGYLSERLAGGVYSYTINVPKITGVPDAAEIDKEAEELAAVFISYVRCTGDGRTVTNRAGWKPTFARMLAAGCDGPSLKHIIAYLATDKTANASVRTPLRLKRDYDELRRRAYAFLSRRRGGRIIYKLKSGIAETFGKKKKAAPSPAPPENPWSRAEKFAAAKKNAFKSWFARQSAGVTDVDFEDYFNQGLLFAYEHFSAGREENMAASAVRYKLQDYMYRKRRCDKNPGARKNGNTILRFFDGDLSEIIERADTAAEGSYDEFDDAAPEIGRLLGVLDERTASVISDYHGLNGRRFTFEEIAAKHGLRSAGYVNKLYHKGLERLRKESPPGSFS